jgi:hypothetical protein
MAWRDVFDGAATLFQQVEALAAASNEAVVRHRAEALELLLLRDSERTLKLHTKPNK